jgi:hypothetical protein
MPRVTDYRSSAPTAGAPFPNDTRPTSLPSGQRTVTAAASTVRRHVDSAPEPRYLTSGAPICGPAILCGAPRRRRVRRSLPRAETAVAITRRERPVWCTVGRPVRVLGPWRDMLRIQARRGAVRCGAQHHRCRPVPIDCSAAGPSARRYKRVWSARLSCRAVSSWSSCSVRARADSITERWRLVSLTIRSSSVSRASLSESC